MNNEELQQILDAHKKWLNNEVGGARADLRGANLRYANLRGAELSNANLRYADLRGAELSYADLSNTDLSYAYLSAEIFCLDRIGSNKRRTTYDATHDIVWCGCFKGTFAEWCKKIKETYPDEASRYRREYDAAIEYLSKLAKIAKESEVRNG